MLDPFGQAFSETDKDFIFEKKKKHSFGPVFMLQSSLCKSNATGFDNILAKL